MIEEREYTLAELRVLIERAAQGELSRSDEKRLADAIGDRLQRDADIIMEQALQIDALLEERDGLRESLANQEWTLKQAELMLRAEGVDPIHP